jgi:hypothetical protein
MQHKIVTVILIFINDMFAPYTTIIRCPSYANLITALLVSILKLKIKFRLKFKLKQVAILNLVKTVSISLWGLLT